MGYIQKKLRQLILLTETFSTFFVAEAKKKLKSLLLLLLPLLIKRAGVAGKLNLVSVSQVLSDV